LFFKRSFSILLGVALYAKMKACSCDIYALIK